ncbi:TRAM LAG1 and CLN8 (TLC) lipid-sensing domain containing protein [Euphorbia peplus]|nr:TRAM LAG1 and CLN8 (TLC) lipid-sensing domain containing protein [Euphorbia peplus]WCJ35250.1 TRAM LAG1 and CLN8 (TLC) lipid-sensing domain containing protein [Euphorbia peplus]
MEEYVNIVILGVIAWGATFILIRLMLRDRSFEFCNRMVSTIHAFLAVGLSSLSVQDWHCPVCPLASKGTPAQIRALSITIAYLIYDLICCLFDKRFNLDNTIHHLVSIVGLGAGLNYQLCVSEMVAALWITELSSPFLHFRKFLEELGYKDTRLNLAADVSFAAIFSIGRMIGGPYLTYLALTAHNPFIMKAMAVGLQLVSAFWFYKIVRMLNYKLSNKTTPKKLP